MTNETAAFYDYMILSLQLINGQLNITSYLAIITNK